MAVGYSHVATVAALLEAGADPEVQDRQSRDVIALVESIRDKMPVAPEYMGRRMALEQVTGLLAGQFPVLNRIGGSWIGYGQALLGSVLRPCFVVGHLVVLLSSLSSAMVSFAA